MESNLYKQLNKGVPHSGYMKWQISAKTLLEMRNMLINEPDKLLNFFNLALSARGVDTETLEDEV